MIKSEMKMRNGAPVLVVDGKPVSPCAYMTYFDERNDYSRFAEASFRVFSVSLSLSSQPINTASGFMPYAGGVFDTNAHPDFSFADDPVRRLLAACPDALIFPRLYVCMPEAWIEKNSADTVPVPHAKRRESLYSDRFRADASAMLRTLISHMEEAPYADHIIGYQISGGNTQEWFHLDLNASTSPDALPFFNRWRARRHLPPVEALPSLSPLADDGMIGDGVLTDYLRFASEEVAVTVETLCKTAKETVGGRKIVGVFYGYTAEVTDPLWGTHALAALLDSPYIDFFSAPNSYMDGRALGGDWPDMQPTASIRRHGKVCFIECDVRTFLTRSPDESRPGSDPLHYYTQKVWAGPPTQELSVWAIRKSLAAQLVRGHGLWWFDMFGHWYASEALMAEMRRSLALFDRRGSGSPAVFPVQTAVFLDETVYARVGKKHPAANAPYCLRKTLGYCGVPYDMVLLSDADVSEEKDCPYKAVIFNLTYEDETVERLTAHLRARGAAVLRITESVPDVDELRAFLAAAGVFLYGESGEVTYVGNGFAAVHAAHEGEKVLRFPRAVRLTDAETGEETVGEIFRFSCKQYETRLFLAEEA